MKKSKLLIHFLMQKHLLIISLLFVWMLVFIVPDISAGQRSVSGKNLSSSSGSTSSEDAALIKTGARFIDARNGIVNKEYVANEILVTFKEGKESEKVLEASVIHVEKKDIEKKHSVRSFVAKLKRENKIQPENNGLYKVAGKNYKDLNKVPEEELLLEVASHMTPTRKKLYRKYKIKLPTNVSVEDAVERLKKNPDVESVYPNYIREVFVAPSDPRFPEQWALPKIQAPEAWTLSQGEGILVAVVDTGVDYNHEDLKSNIWINPQEDLNHNGVVDTTDFNGVDDDNNSYVDDIRGYDFVTVTGSGIALDDDPGPADNDPRDVHGHGTHVSGIIAAVRGNNKGIHGIAPNAKVMALRAGFKTPDGRGSLADSDIEDAILYATDQGAKIISMSFGGPYVGAYEDELRTAYENNIVLVASAGNSPKERKSYPAASPGVIAVAASDSADQKASFSTYGDWVDVTAPGVGILSTTPGDRYESWDGTSMSCPYVSGLAALILARNSQFTPEQVRHIIRASANDVDSSGWDILSGYGRINAFQAVQAQTACPCISRITQLSFSLNSLEPILFVSGSAVGAPSAAIQYTLQLVKYSSGEIIYARDYTSSVNDSLLGEIPIPVTLADGTYVVRLIVSSNGVAFDNKLFILDRVGIESPVENQLVSSKASFDVSGKVADNVYTIAWGEGDSPSTWSTDGVTIGTSLPNGLGTVDARVFPRSGDLTKVFSIKLEDNVGNREIRKINVGFNFKSGWPYQAQGQLSNNNILFNVGDLTSDGTKEIVTVSEDGIVTLLNIQGVPIGQLSLNEYPFYHKPIVTDLDGDGEQEILLFKVSYGQGNNPAKLILLRFASGRLETQWTVNVSEIGIITGGAIVADLDGNGKKEIIISGIGVNTGNLRLAWYTTVYDHLGNRVPGWPQKNISQEYDIYGSLLMPGSFFLVPVAGNLDDDSDLEIFSVAVDTSDSLNENNNTSTFYGTVFNRDGSTLAGWPKSINSVSGPLSYTINLASPIMGDLNKDGKNEVVVGTQNGLFVFDRLGRKLWQTNSLNKEFISDIVLSDLDRDRAPEVVYSACPDFFCDQQTTYVRRGDGSLVSSHPSSTGYRGGSISGDVDKNGTQDIITLRQVLDGPRARFEFWDPRNGSEFYSFDFFKHSPIYPPVVADMDNDGKVELIASYMYGSSGSLNMGVWELDNFPNGDIISDWPMYRHDQEMSGYYVSPVADRVPVFNPIGNQTISEGSQLTFTVSAADLDQDVLSYSAENLPAGAQFNAATRTFSWVPTYEQAGDYSVTFRVSDGQLSDSRLVLISVTDARIPIPPQIISLSPNSGTFYPGKNYTFTSVYADPDGYQDLSLLQWTFVNTNFQNIMTFKFNPQAGILFGRDEFNEFQCQLGSNQILQFANDNLRIDCHDTTVTYSGNTFTITWRMTFGPNYVGDKYIFLYALDLTGASAGQGVVQGQIKILLDTTKPTVASSLGTATSTKITLNASAVDPAPSSGIEKIYYNIRQASFNSATNTMGYVGALSVTKTATGGPASFTTSTDVDKTWFQNYSGVVYTLTGYDLAGNSIVSGKYFYNGTTLAVPDVTAPSVVTGLIGLMAIPVSPNPLQIVLNWNASTDASGSINYYIYRNGAYIGTTATGVKTYTDKTAVLGVTYQYTIKARDVWGNVAAASTAVSAKIGSDTQAPSAPTGLKGEQYNKTYAASLTWSGSTDNSGVVLYEIYRNDLKITTVNAATLTYTDNNLSGGSYQYKVRAIDTVGNASAFSNIVTVSIQAGV